MDVQRRRFYTRLRVIARAIFALAMLSTVSDRFVVCAYGQERSQSLDQLLFESAWPNDLGLEQNYRAGVAALNEDRIGDAIDYFQTIIDSPRDAYPDRTSSANWSANAPFTQQRLYSWKDQAADQLGRLSAEGRKIYAERFETATAAALAALEYQPVEKRRLALRHRWSKSGWNAAITIAAKELDTGQPSNALALLEKLPIDVVPDRDAERANRLAVAEQQLLAEASQPGGNGAGNSRSDNRDAPLTTPAAWSVPLIEDHEVGDLVESWDAAVTGAVDDLNSVQAVRKSRRAAIEPLIVDSTAMFAGMGRARAYDLETGTLLWRSALADSTLRYLASRAIGIPGQTQENRRLWLAERLASDRTQGAMTSDGTLAFAVIDGGADIRDDTISASSWEHPLSRSSENRLVAFEVSTGRIAWWVGGPNSGPAPPPLAGAYFLGPPSFHDGFGYALIEVGGVIQFVELDLKTGMPITTVDLWNDRNGQANDQGSQATQGTRPLFAGSLAICSLKHAVVAFNIDTQSLAWTIPASPGTALDSRLQSGLNEGRELHAQIAVRAAIDAYPRTVLTKNAVIVVGKRTIQSVKLSTGEVEWLNARADISWVEAVTPSQLTLVTSRGLEGVDAGTGERLWERPLPPLSGSGILVENRLTVPLATSELATVDLSNGRLIARTPVRGKRPLGTLVTNGLYTVTFDGHSLSAMPAIEPAEISPSIAKLTDKKRDQWVNRATEALHQSNAETAISILELLVGADSPENDRVETKSVAEETEYAAVQTMLAAALTSQPNIAPERFSKLVSRVDLEALPLTTAVPMRRLLIRRAAESGNHIEEAEHHIALIGFGRTNDFVDISANRRINVHQQSVSRLATLVNDLSNENRRSLSEWVSAYVESASVDVLNELARSIPRLVCSNQTALRLAKAAEPEVLRELLLWDLIDQLPEAERSTTVYTDALLGLGTLYAKHGRTFDLLDVVEKLEAVSDDSDPTSTSSNHSVKSDAGNVSDNQPGRENEPDDTTVFVEPANDLPTNGNPTNQDVVTFLERRDIGRLLNRVPSWDAGPIDVERRSAASYGDGTRPLKTFRLGRASHSLPFWNATPQARAFRLIGPQGEMAETFPAAPSIFYSFSRVSHVDLIGHLAVVSSIDRAEVFDTLSHPVRRLGVLKHLPGDDPRAALAVATQRAGLKSMQTLDVNGRSFGSVGPPSATLLTYLRNDRLVAVDPFDINGSPLWEVAGVTPGSEILGDSKVVLVREPGDVKLRGFDAQSGIEIDVADVPKTIWFAGQAPLVGRCMLTLETDDEGKRLALFDPVAKTNVWKLGLPVDATLVRDMSSAEDQNLLLVGSPVLGSVSLYRLTDGEQIANAAVRTMLAPEYSLHRAGGKAFVFTGLPPTEIIPDIGASERRALPLQSGRDAALVNGPVIAFDLTTGETLWTREIDDQRFTAGQPATWPMLVFASNYVAPFDDGTSRVERGMHVEMIDKQTGETLWDEDQLPYELKQTWKPTPNRVAGTDIDFQSFVLKVRPQTVATQDESAAAPPAQSAEPATDEKTPREKTPSENSAIETK